MITSYPEDFTPEEMNQEFERVYNQAKKEYPRAYKEVLSLFESDWLLISDDSDNGEEIECFLNELGTILRDNDYESVSFDESQFNVIKSKFSSNEIESLINISFTDINQLGGELFVRAICAGAIMDLHYFGIELAHDKWEATLEYCGGKMPRIERINDYDIKIWFEREKSDM